jgi:hypothetical protein
MYPLHLLDLLYLAIILYHLHLQLPAVAHLLHLVPEMLLFPHHQLLSLSSSLLLPSQHFLK